MKNKKIKVFAITLLLLSLLTITISGTLALMNFSPEEADPSPIWQVMLINDFEERENWTVQNNPMKNRIAVENPGNPLDQRYQGIFVRIQLREFMILNSVIRETTPIRYMADSSGNWIVFSDLSDAQAAFGSRNYVHMTCAMSGVTGYFVPIQLNDANRDHSRFVTTRYELIENQFIIPSDQAEGERLVNLGVLDPNISLTQHEPGTHPHCQFPYHPWDATDINDVRAQGAASDYIRLLLGEDVILLSDWIAAGEEHGAIWVIDDREDSEGWIYWADELLPGEQTSNFMEALELLIQPAGKFRYFVHIEMCAISIFELHQPNGTWGERPSELFVNNNLEINITTDISHILVPSVGYTQTFYATAFINGIDITSEITWSLVGNPIGVSLASTGVSSSVNFNIASTIPLETQNITLRARVISRAGLITYQDITFTIQPIRTAANTPIGETFIDTRGTVWRVLERDELGRTLIITEHVFGLGQVYFATGAAGNEFRPLNLASGVRGWLNGWFNSTVAPELRLNALEAVGRNSDIRTQASPGGVTGTPPGNAWMIENQPIGHTTPGSMVTLGTATQNNAAASQALFILSNSEFNHFVGTGALNNLATNPAGQARWWHLRSPGQHTSDRGGPMISIINDIGVLTAAGANQENAARGYRPAMWVDTTPNSLEEIVRRTPVQNVFAAPDGTEWRVLSHTMGPGGHDTGTDVLIISDRVVQQTRWNTTATTSGGYANSEIRNTTLVNFYRNNAQWAHRNAVLPGSTVANGFSAVNNLTERTTSSGIRVNTMDSYVDGAFLLSHSDLLNAGFGFATGTAANPARVTQLPRPSTTNNVWWTRTPIAATTARSVGTNGAIAAANTSNVGTVTTNGLRPAMILSFD